LARERERGRSFAEAWEPALTAIRDGRNRDALVSTRQVWQDAYEGKPTALAVLNAARTT